MKAGFLWAAVMSTVVANYLMLAWGLGLWPWN